MEEAKASLCGVPVEYFLLRSFEEVGIYKEFGLGEEVVYVGHPGAVNSLSDRKVVECRDIGLFSISNSISCRTSHIEYIR